MTSQHAAAPAQGEPSIHADDWADKLALEIALDHTRLGTRHACELTAARLRLVKCQGVYEGADGTAKEVERLMRESRSVQQREHQRDHDDERQHGWAAE